MYLMSRAIAAFASKLKISYPTAVGLIVLLNELDHSNELEGMSDEIFWMNLGGKQRFTKDCLLDSYKDISEAMKRERERDRKRDYRAKLSHEMSRENWDKTGELSHEMSQARERESIPLISPSPQTQNPIKPLLRKR